MLATGYLNTKDLDYPIFRGNLIKNLKEIPKVSQDKIKFFLELYHKLYPKNPPICSVICETFIIDNHDRKVELCYGFYKLNGMTWAQHVWINYEGLMIDLRAVYENYFGMNSVMYTDVKLCFTLGWYPGDYEYNEHMTDYLERNQDKINKNLSLDSIRNMKVTLHDNLNRQSMEQIFDNLNEIKEQLFDAPTEVKTAFNDVVQYFSGKKLRLNANKVYDSTKRTTTRDNLVEALKIPSKIFDEDTRENDYGKWYEAVTAYEQKGASAIGSAIGKTFKKDFYGYLSTRLGEYRSKDGGTAVTIKVDYDTGLRTHINHSQVQTVSRDVKGGLRLLIELPYTNTAKSLNLSEMNEKEFNNLVSALKKIDSFKIADTSKMLGSTIMEKTENHVKSVLSKLMNNG